MRAAVVDRHALQAVRIIDSREERAINVMLEP